MHVGQQFKIVPQTVLVVSYHDLGIIFKTE